MRISRRVFFFPFEISCYGKHVSTIEEKEREGDIYYFAKIINIHEARLELLEFLS